MLEKQNTGYHQHGRSNVQKKGPKGPQKLSSLKSLRNQNPPSIKDIFTHATIIIGFFIKFLVEKPEKTYNSIHKYGDILSDIYLIIKLSF